MGLSTPAKVGLLTIVALIALGALVVWKTEFLMVRGGYEMTGTFQNIEGLTIGSEVRYRGFKVGRVMKIDPGPYEIKVYTIINGSIKFPIDSELRIAYDGIVGLKFLEVRPGTSEMIYTSDKTLNGLRTSGIVDFIDIGSQNLQETKRIMENIRMIVENKQLQESILNTVFTANRVVDELEKLANELRQTNKGVQTIVADPKFQENIKGTANEIDKTLSSANNFFGSLEKVKMRVSGGVDVGTTANSVMGDIDVMQSENNYLRFGVGEGPSRQPSLLDILFNSRMTDNFAFRLGIINHQLGGGVSYYLNDNKAALIGDIYDINNQRPNFPKLRLGYGFQWRPYMDINLRADDLLNENTRNVSIGIKVKPPDEVVF